MILLTKYSVFLLVAALIISSIATITNTMMVSAQTSLLYITSFKTVGMDVRLEFLSSPPNNETLQVTFSSTQDVDPYSGKYFGIGKSDGYMSGPIVACSFPSSSADPSSKCTNMDGDGYGADVSGTQPVVLVSSTAGTTTSTVVFQIPTSYFFTDGGYATPGLQRWIFARGNWESHEGGKPGHHEDWFSQIGIDFKTGLVEQPDDRSTPDTHWALFRAWLATILVGLLGVAIQQTERFQPNALAINVFRHPTVKLVLQIITWIVIGSCFIGVLITSYNEYKHFYKVSPFARSLGAGACYLFSLLLMPTTRYFNIGILAGGNYENFISWHAIGGIAIYAIITLHFFAMFIASASVGFASVIFSAGDGVQPILCAFLGWLVFTTMFVFALFRNNKKSKFFKYYYFKVSHCLFPLLLLLFILHLPALGLCILPGLLLYIGDVVLRLVRTRDEFYAPRLREIEVDKESQVTKLVIEYSSTANDNKYLGNSTELHQVGGSFFVMSFEDSKGEFICPHPFSVAHVDQVDKKHKLVFYVRNTMVISGSSSSLAITNFLASQLPDRWANEKAKLRQFIGPMGAGRIDELLKNVLSRSSTSTLKSSVYAAAEQIQGREGTEGSQKKDEASASGDQQQQQPAKEPKNTVLFVSGGIGITVMLGLLQSLVMTAKLANGSSSGAASAGESTTRVNSSVAKGLEKLNTVLFIWSVREQSLINMIQPQVEKLCREASSISGLKFKILAKFFVTTGKREALPKPGADGNNNGDGDANPAPSVLTSTSSHKTSSSSNKNKRGGGNNHDSGSVTIESGRRIGDNDLYPEHVPDPTNYFCFSCGPPGLMDLVRTTSDKQRANNSSAYVSLIEEVFEY